VTYGCSSVAGKAISLLENTPALPADVREVNLLCFLHDFERVNILIPFFRQFPLLGGKDLALESAD
jgi:hypothetical protein